jgi:AraC-like DNA-binding protein
MTGTDLGDAPIDAFSLELVESLFDHLPNAPFFAKNRSLRYVAANTAMLDLCGVRSRTDLIGKSARDFFPDFARRRYEILDRQVMRTLRPIKDQLHLSVRTRGVPVWLLFGRWPVILGPRREVVGVAAIARNLDTPDRRRPEYERLAVALEHIQTNFGAPLDIPALAHRAGVSVSRLERDFVSLFGLPPRRYLTKVRFEAALNMLLGDEPIVDIAHACGYADQSAFTRAFRAAAGVSPTEYRRRHGQA